MTARPSSARSRAMESAISPADCALAVALPLTEQRFLRDAAAPDKDFARSVIATSGRSPLEAWTELYAPKVVALYERVAARVRRLGATVASDVTAAALHELLGQFSVVSLFAHAMAAPVRSGDIIKPRAVLDI